jgi:Flp pilus assembly protein TadB
MSTPSEHLQHSERASSRASHHWALALFALGALLIIGLLLRLAGLPVPAWALLVTAALLVFVFILPALGGRMHEPEGSPLKKAPWGF